MRILPAATQVALHEGAITHARLVLGALQMSYKCPTNVLCSPANVMAYNRRQELTPTPTSAAANLIGSEALAGVLSDNSSPGARADPVSDPAPRWDGLVMVAESGWSGGWCVQWLALLR